MTRKKRIVLGVSALLLSLSSTSCSANEVSKECHLAIKQESFGDILLNENLGFIESKYEVETIAAGEANSQTLYHEIKYCADSKIRVRVRNDGNIFMLKSTSPSLIYHGYKFSDLSFGILNGLTQNNEIFWAHDEGKKYFFKPEESNLTFFLGYDALSDSCVENYSNCSVEEKQIRPQEVFTYKFNK